MACLQVELRVAHLARPVVADASQALRDGGRGCLSSACGLVTSSGLGAQPDRPAPRNQPHARR
jgi:hypothetical protein